MFSAFQSFFRKRPPEAVHRTYIALVQRARNPFFYTDMGVPDTIDGRFGLIVLHLFLLESRLKDVDPEFARFLSEAFFDDMDASIREIGIGDSGVKHRIKKMGRNYHGCLQAYTTHDDEALKAALARNLYGTVTQGDVAVLTKMVAYIRGMENAIAKTDIDLILSGNYAWPVLP